MDKIDIKSFVFNNTKKSRRKRITVKINTYYEVNETSTLVFEKMVDINKYRIIEFRFNIIHKTLNIWNIWEGSEKFIKEIIDIEFKFLIKF